MNQLSAEICFLHNHRQLLCHACRRELIALRTHIINLLTELNLIVPVIVLSAGRLQQHQWLCNTQRNCSHRQHKYSGHCSSQWQAINQPDNSAQLHSFTMQGHQTCFVLYLSTVFYCVCCQQIDGEAFLLLTQADIVRVLKIKLGPAIKIYNSILMINNNMDMQAKATCTGIYLCNVYQPICTYGAHMVNGCTKSTQ